MIQKYLDAAVQNVEINYRCEIQLSGPALQLLGKTIKFYGRELYTVSCHFACQKQENDTEILSHTTRCTKELSRGDPDGVANSPKNALAKHCSAISTINLKRSILIFPLHSHFFVDLENKWINIVHERNMLNSVAVRICAPTKADRTVQQNGPQLYTRSSVELVTSHHTLNERPRPKRIRVITSRQTSSAAKMESSHET